MNVAEPVRTIMGNSSTGETPSKNPGAHRRRKKAPVLPPAAPVACATQSRSSPPVRSSPPRRSSPPIRSSPPVQSSQARSSPVPIPAKHSPLPMNAYAGARFHESPSPKVLPKPPLQWVHETGIYHETATAHLKTLLGVQA